MPALVPGAKRKIYRGDVSENVPQIREALAAVAGLKPGCILMQAAAPNAAKLGFGVAASGYFVVCNAPMHQHLEYVHAADEMVQAYIPRSGDVYLVRATAGLVGPKDTPLSIGANGRVVVAAADANDRVIVGYLHEALTSAVLVDALVDMRIK